MLIRLTLVAALMAFVSATTTNLRSSTEDAVLPSEVMDSELTAKFVASFMKQSETLTKKAQVEHAKLVKLAMEAKTMKTSNTELMELRQGGGEKYVTDGYYVQKRRANSDCSGAPDYYSGRKIGLCFETSVGYMSGSTVCVNNYHEGMVYEMTELFSNTDCSGPPFEIIPGTQPQPACGLDLDYYHDTLSFTSKSSRCFPGTKGLDLPPGLSVTTHTESNCQDQPTSFYHSALNTCSQSLDESPENLNSKSGFSSMKYTSCSSTELEITMCSDASCLRPTMKYTMKNHPYNGQCVQAGENFYVQYSCSA